MDYAKLDDEALIRLIHRRDSNALSALYDRYARLIFSLAFNIVGDNLTSEEITQDVFLNVWNGAGSYHSGKARVNTWLASIARHRAIDVLRKWGARAEGHAVSWAEEDFEAVPSDTALPESVERAFEGEQVRQAIAQLPAEQQQTLALAYFKGYTHQQIAEALHEPLGTVKTRIRLAMQKLRVALEQQLAD